MGQGIKIVTIGGGSSYTPELIEGFIKRYQQLPVKEIWLVDIEEGKEKLEIVGNLAKRMVKKAGLPITIHLTLNRQSALKDADFVTTQFRVGGLEAREKDELIPLKFNIIGQETNGPGGMFKGLRTIPVILDICKEMDALCPDAWLINFTNPAGMISEAIAKYSPHTKFVGLCNGPLGIKKDIVRLLGVEEHRVYVTFVGLNHMVFAKRIYVDGKDVTKEVMDLKIKNNDGVSLKNIEDTGWDAQFLRALGMIPIDYLRYYYQTSLMLHSQQEAVKNEGSRAQVVKKLEDELFTLYKDPQLNVKPKQLEYRGGAYYSDAACNLICSIYNNTGDIQVVNVKNNGAISDMEVDEVVEVNCKITSMGPIPLTTGSLPIQIKGLVRQIKSFEQLTAKAAVTGDYQTALLALTINPLTTNDKDARKILDEMILAHKQYLPQFVDGVTLYDK